LQEIGFMIASCRELLPLCSRQGRSCDTKHIVDAGTKRILRAAAVGPGDEVIHCVLDLMYAKAPFTVMHHAMHTRPTVSEYIRLRPL
jgi:pyruvate/2-oxoglutarate dehydrogenase complex dihydrolipoamide dehydrogenase (E3) component